MKAIGYLGIHTMKSSCRVLITRQSSSFFPFPKCHSRFLINNSSKSRVKFDFKRNLSTFPSQTSKFHRLINPSWRDVRLPASRFGQSRVLSSRDSVGMGSVVSAATNVGSNIRSLSTQVETRVNDKNFERIYVQGGIHGKPLVVERIDIDETAGREDDPVVELHAANAKLEDLEDLKKHEALNPKRAESEIEKEAWNLLRNSVVTYCGSPIGTVAANDPGDKQPLNYDQVFIRDFVPSALAFLLKGEGEIVRNFLLHNLQLQVIYIPNSFYFTDCYFIYLFYFMFTFSVCCYIPIGPLIF